jgi:hypothetical protein
MTNKNSPNTARNVKLRIYRSPAGGAILAATTSNVFKIINTHNWTQERWTVLSGNSIDVLLKGIV